jgi:two-component system phosphate regulon sensor histidine kinase PhoR
MDTSLFANMGADPEGKTREELIAILKDFQSRLAELNWLAVEHTRSEEALRLDEARLEALLRLNDMTMAPIEDIIAYSLEEAIRLTGSKIGWMGALSPDEKRLVMYCWSKGTVKGCGIPDYSHAPSVCEGGIWMEPVAQRKPVIVNDLSSYASKGVPGGHVSLTRFMGVPIYDGQQIIAVAEVGNKEADYDSPDLRQLSLLMTGVWRIILRKRAEEALSESRAQAELYVDFMGHDINNMNQVAMGFLELALEKLDTDGKLDGKDKSLLEKPMETMRNNARLIDNVKKLQRLRAGMIESSLFDLGSVLLEATRDIGYKPGRSITINYQHASGCYVRANELLKDVFSNILGNSVKHSPPDKPLSIGIGISPTGNDFYKISIEDDGPGIPEKRKNEIFDRLSQGKMKALRTGLGLGLVKTLVESYHGRIWVEDRVEGDHKQGCRFVVMLPKAGPTPQK